MPSVSGFDFSFHPFVNQSAGDECGVLHCEDNLGDNSTDTRKLEGLTLYMQTSEVRPESRQWRQLATITSQTPGKYVEKTHQSGRLSSNRAHLRLKLVNSEECMATQFSCLAIMIDAEGKATLKNSVIRAKVGSDLGPGLEETRHEQISASTSGIDGQSDKLSSAILEKLRCIGTRLSETLRENDKLEDKLESLKDSMAEKINGLEKTVFDKLQFSEIRINDKIINLKDRLDDKLSELKVRGISDSSNFQISKDMCKDIRTGEEAMHSLQANISSFGFQLDKIENAVIKSESLTTTMDDKLQNVISRITNVSTHTRALTDSVVALGKSCVKDKPQTVGEFFDPLGTGEQDWRLAFRGTAHNGVQIYPAYLYGTGIPAEVEIGCKQFNQSLPCINHFRNWDALENWSNVDEVLFAIYVNNHVVKHIIFNGIGSTSTNWFEKNRVIVSSWSDLKSLSHNYFSIKGDSRSHLTRRFLVNHYYRNCDTDKGWFLASDIAPGHCPWEKKLVLPVFLYASDNTVSVWKSNAVARADSFGIFLKYN